IVKEEKKTIWIKQKFLNKSTFDHQNSENGKLFSVFSGSSDWDSLIVHSRPQRKKPHSVSNRSPICTSKLTQSFPASPSTSDFCQTHFCLPLAQCLVFNCFVNKTYVIIIIS
uniref:Uncharacterized protein n=1 Tax=Spermophilus dauricus TaxID=99837 RepID=A0A8C9PIQ9_SPEDA